MYHRSNTRVIQESIVLLLYYSCITGYFRRVEGKVSTDYELLDHVYQELITPRVTVSDMDNAHTFEGDNQSQSVEYLTDKALAAARAEFQKKEDSIKRVLTEGISAFRDIDHHAEKHKEAQQTLAKVLSELSELDVDRSVLLDALGISSASLTRRLPQSAKRAPRGKKKPQ